MHKMDINIIETFPNQGSRVDMFYIIKWVKEVKKLI